MKLNLLINQIYMKEDFFINKSSHFYLIKSKSINLLSWYHHSVANFIKENQKTLEDKFLKKIKAHQIFPDVPSYKEVTKIQLEFILTQPVSQFFNKDENSKSSVLIFKEDIIIFDKQKKEIAIIRPKKFLELIPYENHDLQDIVKNLNHNFFNLVGHLTSQCDSYGNKISLPEEFYSEEPSLELIFKYNKFNVNKEYFYKRYKEIYQIFSSGLNIGNYSNNLASLLQEIKAFEIKPIPPSKL